MSSLRLTVLADMRWPRQTGIGEVQDAYMSRKPEDILLVDLQAKGRIGSPLSPLFIALALWRARQSDALFWSAGFVPPLFGCHRSVVFVHDLTHMKYYNSAHRIYYNIVLKTLYRRCAAIVCVSEYTRSEFLAWSKVDPAKVYVLKNGVPKRFIENKSSFILPYKYVLYPGNHRPHKNLGRLIHGFAKSGISRAGFHLVITGNENFELKALIQDSSLDGYVHFHGIVPADEIAKLYRGAEAIAFVSLDEGFGLPILEGMASDVPVLTSEIAAMPEIAGDAALIVNPLSVDAIADALHRITSDKALRELLIKKGRTRTRLFDWDSSAAAFWQLMRNVQENPPAKPSPRAWWRKVMHGDVT
jgi:glycosyltransferase involved in cell wall biosynthesis